MKIFASFLRSFKKALLTDEEVKKLKNQYPRITAFLKQRFDKTKFSGLSLTILVCIFFYVFFSFVDIVKDFLTFEPLLDTDLRVNTLLYVFRNPMAVQVFLWITLLGEVLTVGVFTILTSIFLWISHKRWQIVALCLTLVGSEALTFLLKIIFHRPRPLNAVILETSNSFPSGHATIALAFYGFILYLFMRKMKKNKYRIPVFIFFVLLIFAIGFSRLYLGVHYVSDVWTGYLVGLLGLVCGIGISENKIFQAKLDGSGQKHIPHRHSKKILLFVSFIAFVFYIAYGFLHHPEFVSETSTTVHALVQSTASIFDDFSLPKNTETLTGNTQEPISFVITAKDDASFISRFENSGWLLADSANVHSTFKAFKDAFQNKQYFTAPMTPSFWNKQVHDFGFEKSTETKSIRQRHHARFWKTNFTTSDGQSIYVGTTSLDTGIKWMITHKISPDIDTERELLFTDLQKEGAVKSFEKVKFVSPVLGKNFTGDPFFTDGNTYFLHF